MLLPRPVPVLRDVTMSDGASLQVAHHPPATAGSRAPVLVSMTPYGKESPDEQAYPVAGLTAAGYHVVVADVRGTGGSGGAFEGALSPREVRDGVELLEWAADQDFGTGQTGLWGTSYMGANQLLIAAQRPRGLRCLATCMGPGDFYRDATHRGGIPGHSAWGALVFLHRNQTVENMRRGLVDWYVDVMGESFDGPRFRERSAEDALAAVDVPSLCIGGWSDCFLRSTVRTFQGLTVPKRLVIGPWPHEAPDQLTHLVPWFDHWFHGRGDDPTAGDRVALWCVGREGWLPAGDWPATAEIAWSRWQPSPAASPVPAVRMLEQLAPPTAVAGADPIGEWVTNTGMHWWGEAWQADAPPVPVTTRLLGPVGLALELVVEGCDDVDVHARLTHRPAATGDPGRQLCEGRLRASHRALDRERSALSSDGTIVTPWHPHVESEALAPGEPVTLHLELDPIHVELQPGDRLHLGLSFVRADGVVGPASATLLPGTTVLLPGTVS